MNRRRFHPLTALLLVVAGCNGAVREDRTIHFTADGRAAAFQHNEQGVYVADAAGKKVKQIYQPDATVAATSPPLPAPADGRLIFTTARRLDGLTAAQGSVFNLTDPAGRQHLEGQARYTLWLRDNPDAVGGAPAPKPLFEVDVRLLGYVAAGLGVRWHPDGRSILHVAAEPDGLHGLYEYDLASKARRRIFPLRAEALLFDWAPKGDKLVCVLYGDVSVTPGQTGGTLPPVAGVWIGTPGDDDSWWNVPNSAPEEGAASKLEAAKSVRPAWTADGRRFAFATVRGNADKSSTYILRLGDLQSRTVLAAAESVGAIDDLHWAPDGKRLGYIERNAGELGAIKFYTDGAGVTEPLQHKPVRRFAGFRPAGDRMAYLSPTVDPATAPQHWATLLLPDYLATDAVHVAAASGAGPDKEVFNGMRVTFPKWSPTEDKLSLWLTYAPTYRSLPSVLGLGGLQRGDPAAVLNLSNGDVAWLAINADEEIQIGHYHLKRREYPLAIEWYERGIKKMPKAESPSGVEPFFRHLGTPRQYHLFYAYALRKVGRENDAAAFLGEFERTFFPLAAAKQEPGTSLLSVADALIADSGADGEMLLQLIHDLYVAEVFLSLNAADDGSVFLHERLRAAKNDFTKFPRAVVVSQVDLIRGDFQSYIDVCLESILPAYLRLAARPAANVAALIGGPALVMRMALMPLISERFLKDVPNALVRNVVERFEKLRAATKDEEFACALDCALRAAYRRLGRANDAAAANDRFEKSPARQALGLGGDVTALAAQWNENIRHIGLQFRSAP